MKQDEQAVQCTGPVTIHTTNEAPLPLYTSYSSLKIGELALALSKAQGEYGDLRKNKTAKIGDKYSYNYADIADVIECIKKPLSKNEIAYVQSPIWDQGKFYLESKIIHSSGEWMGSRIALPMNSGPQDLGSALTYMRRYALCGLIGIAAEEDDDGKAGQDSFKNKPKPPATKPKPDPIAEIWSTAKEVDISAKDFKGALPILFKKNTSKDLNLDDIKKLATLVKKGKEAFILKVIESEEMQTLERES